MHLKFYIMLGFLRASTKASADILLKYLKSSHGEALMECRTCSLRHME